MATVTTKPMNQTEAAQRIRAMKSGKQFTATSNKDRILLLKVAKTLRAAGVIEFQIITKSDGNGGFLIVAV